MFSGIVAKKGKLIRQIKRRKNWAFTFEAAPWEKPLKRGESIAVNGVCLTVAKIQNRKRFTAELVPDTLRSSTLGELKLNSPVNLERSLQWGERISGHFVLGHVDGVGKIVKKKMHGRSFSLTIEVPPRFIQHLVPKGSVAVDGVSLTIQKMTESVIEVAVIPHTAKETTLGQRKVSDRVNLEADVIAKHLAKWVEGNSTELLTI